MFGSSEDGKGDEDESEREFHRWRYKLRIVGVVFGIGRVSNVLTSSLPPLRLYMAIVSEQSLLVSL